MSDEHNIYNILENLDRAQKSVKQLPALFKPDSASPALDGDYSTKNVTRGYLVGESGSYDASMDPEYRRPQSRQVDPDDRDQEPVSYGSSPGLQRSPEQEQEFDKYMRHLERKSMREAAAGDFAVGDPVVITGNVQFKGKTGDVREVGRDGAFVVVDLYNYGPRSFHSTDVSYNDYADSDDEQEYQQGVAEGSEEGFSIEDMVMDQYRNGNDVWEIASNLGMSEDEVQDIINDSEQGVAEGSDNISSMIQQYEDMVELVYDLPPGRKKNIAIDKRDALEAQIEAMPGGVAALRKWAKSYNDAVDEGVAEGNWSKDRAGNYLNTHTGVRNTSPSNPGEPSNKEKSEYYRKKLAQLKSNPNSFKTHIAHAEKMLKRYSESEQGVAEASDISGLMAAASMVQDYIITAEVDGETKKFRVRGMTGPRAAQERFLKHASQARVIDVKPAAEKNVAEGDIDEGWKQNLAALGVAGALGLGSVGPAQASTDPASDKIVATLVIDGEQRMLDLSSKNFSDVRAAEKFVRDFMQQRGIDDYQYVIKGKGQTARCAGNCGLDFGNTKESALNEFEMPVGQATGAAAQINNKPKKTYSVKVVGTFTNPTVFMAKQLWSALEEILPRDYPRVPYQQQHATDPQRRVIDDIRDDGFAIVKQGIKSLDIANTIASNFEARQIPAEVISGGLYEDESSQFVPKAGDEILWRPRNAKMAPVPVTVLAVNAEKIKIKLQSARLIQQRGGKDTMVVSRATSDIMPKQSVAEASPMDNPDFAAGLAAARAGQGPLAIMLAQPSIANDQKMLDTIASSYNLPAGMSAQDIRTQSGSAALRRALDDVARNLGLPTGLSRKELLAAFKKQQSLSESTATTEDVISAVKRKLGDYLQDVATAIKKDPDIIAKIPQDIDQIKAVKTIVTDDGHEIKIHGNEDDGFRVNIKNRDAKARFKSLDEAAIAAEMYCARRRSQSDSQDYLEEQ